MLRGAMQHVDGTQRMRIKTPRGDQRLDKAQEGGRKPGFRKDFSG